MKAFLDTGFLLTMLTQRRGAGTAWELLRQVEPPVGISSLQLFMIRHGLTKSLLEPNTVELKTHSENALRVLSWLMGEDVLNVTEVEYEDVVSLAGAWSLKLKDPIPALLLLWSSCAAASGSKVFLSFDPRTRALAKAAGMKVLPERL